MSDPTTPSPSAASTATESVATILTALAAAFPPASVASAVFQLGKTLLPLVEKHIQTGQVTVEQQAQVRADYESLRTLADGQFAGPQWKPSDS